MDSEEKGNQRTIQPSGEDQSNGHCEFRNAIQKLFESDLDCEWRQTEEDQQSIDSDDLVPIQE
jgi:hypothetical protein